MNLKKLYTKIQRAGDKHGELWGFIICFAFYGFYLWEMHTFCG